MIKTLLLALAFLTIASTSFAQVEARTLAWDAEITPGSGITSFKLYEKGGTAAAPTWALVANIPYASIQPAAPRYTLNITEPNKTHTYALTAVNAAGIESARSNEAGIPGAPTGFRVEVVVNVLVN